MTSRVLFHVKNSSFNSHQNLKDEEWKFLSFLVYIGNILPKILIRGYHFACFMILIAAVVNECLSFHRGHSFCNLKTDVVAYNINIFRKICT